MRQVLFRIPVDGSWPLGPLDSLPGFGFGFVLLAWCLFAAAWLYTNRADLALNKQLIAPVAIWAAIAAGIVLLPVLLQRSSRKTIDGTTAALARLKPADSEYRNAFDARDRAWRYVSESAKAVAACKSEIEKRPQDPNAHIRLAWILATSPFDETRDAKQAKSHANAALELMGRQETKSSQIAAALDALAAAHAAAGEFDQALMLVRQAADQAAGIPSDDSADNGQLIAIRQRIELYRNERPYLDKRTGTSVPVYGYGLMLFLGFATAGWMAIRRGSWVGIDKDTIWDVSLWVLIGGIGGARLFYVIQYRDVVFRGKDNFGEYAFAFVNLREGGLVLYGGVIVALSAYLFFCYRRKLNILLMTDVVIPSFFIGLAFGRLGCFMNGCCYGDRCELPWAITFPLGSVPDTALVNRGFVGASDLLSLQLHPSQLYSSLNALILALLTHMYFKVRHRDGAVLGVALLTYPISRFLIEYVRGDEMGKFDTPLTISQWVSLGLLAVGIVYVLWLSRRKATVTPLGTPLPPPEASPST